MKPNIKLRYLAIIFYCFLLNQFAQAQSPYYTYVDPNTRTLDKSIAKVGTLPGTININSTGAATYEIPVFISPGTAGMQPNISIVYNSMNDDGILGKGWGIAGLSEIRRVSQNFYHESNVTGVTLQNTDRFGLDSNRLILTSGSQYGADLTEYCTEIETFVKVIAHGTAGTGPSWFEVKTKDGRTLEYGNTSDSKVEAIGSSTVYMWRINKVSDQNNNSMEFEYYEVNGESYIKQINYSKNIPAGLTTPYNALKFNYYTDPRTDNNILYVAGSQIPRTKLLSSIRMETEGSALVREYQFKYVLDTYTHLNQITEFGSDGTYINSTVIGWGVSTSAISPSVNAFNNGKRDKFYFGDFNGDGRKDFVVTEKKTSFTTADKWKLYLANTEGTSFSFINEGSLDGTFKEFVVADVDGNGKDDIFRRVRETVYYNCNPHPCTGGIESTVQTSTITDIVNPPPSDTCWDVCSYQREAFKYYFYVEDDGLIRGSSSYDITLSPTCPADISLIPIELDGNGKIDYLVLTSAKNIYEIRGITYTGNPNFNTPNEVRYIDFNGNGKQDILVIKNSTSYIYEFNSISQQFGTIYSSTTYPTSSDRLFFGDFNGDRNTDFLSWKSGSGWSLKLSSGTTLISSTAPGLINVDPNLSLSDNNYYIGDFNGDKKDDILEVYKVSPDSRLKVFYSTGIGSFTIETNTYSKVTVNQDFFNICDFNGDGQKDVFYYDYNLTTNYADIRFFHKDELKHVVKTLVNGLNFKTQIVYTRINADIDTAFYKTRSSALFPLYDFKGPIFAVSSVIAGDSSYTKYYYDGLKIHRQGKGLLGFTKTKMYDEYDKFKSINTYEFDGTYFFRALKKFEFTYNTSTLLNQYTNINQVISYGNKRIFPYVDQVETWDNLKKIITVSNNDYDNYGNLTNTSISYQNEAHSQEALKSNTNIIGMYGNYGIPNKITKTTATVIYTGQPAYTREIEYYYDIKGNLTQSISDPGKSKAVTKTYFINSFGLTDKDLISASGLDSISTNYGYDSKYRFVINVTNPLGYIVRTRYNQATGNLVSKTDIRGKIDSMVYDGLGRLKKTMTPLGPGHDITVDLTWDLMLEGGTNSLFRKTTINPGNPTQESYFDLLGREIKSAWTGYSGDWLMTETIYSSMGISKRSKPHDEDLPPSLYKCITSCYDSYGRLLTNYDESGGDFYIYDGRTTTVEYKGNITKAFTINALGNVISVKENNNNNLVTNYVYHSSGQVKEINSAGNIISTVYDEYGLPTSITDPNSGTSTLTYNAFGEKTSCTNSENITYNYNYDKLGRMLNFTTAEESTNLTYFNSGSGIGQLNSMTGPNNISRDYTYDVFGRVIKLRDSIPGEVGLSTSFVYDSFGNNTTIIYPEGFSVNNVYNNGYLKEIRKQDNSLIWKVDVTNAFDQPVIYTLGPQNKTTTFTYDNMGLGYLTSKNTVDRVQTFNFDLYNFLLMTRGYTSDSQTRSESFTYDNLERLKTSTINGQNTININYADNGNIQDKTGVGNYDYLTGKVNAVKNITNNPGSVSSTSQLIDYTSFNKVSSLTEGNNSLEITYGPDQQRIKTVLKAGETTIKTKYYSLNYELEITSTGTRHLYYISSPFGLVALNIKQGESENLYFVETDHLGSIIALINPDGSVDSDKKFSYDAWGRRRNPIDWSNDNIPQTFFIDRGFTGHEHYDIFNLIDMNGRVYDPVIGRFLSPDPIIQSSDFTQSFNSYSYCFNNPLKYSDPTGYNAYGNPWTDQDGKYHPLSEQIDALFNPGQLADMLPHLDEFFGGDQPEKNEQELVKVYVEGIGIVYVPRQVAYDPKKLKSYINNNEYLYTKEEGYTKNTLIHKITNSDVWIQTNYISNVISFVYGTSATLAAIDLNNAKYAVANQNLASQADFLEYTIGYNMTMFSGFAGSFTNGLESISAYQDGNKQKSMIDGIQTIAYSAGTYCLIVPFIGDAVGGGIIAVTGLSDIIQAIIEGKK
jgi:RHS repeat-associated protein